MDAVVTAAELVQLARDCGFDLVGIAPAEPLPEASFYLDWVRRGRAAGMRYLSDHRAGKRLDPRDLLGSARSVICCGVLYNTREGNVGDLNDPERGWIARYAWGEDYHNVLYARFQSLIGRLAARVAEPFEYKICVDTAPLLERAYAQRAGLGWIGKNTCLINEAQGSWFFLGELLTSLYFRGQDDFQAPPFRCGSCTACIDACPTAALVPTGHAAPAWELVPERCISYHTIESRTVAPEELRPGFGNHVFGCDICQDVCPWNRRAGVSIDPAFQPRHYAPPLEQLAALTEREFRQMFQTTPVVRARYHGFLRNVAMAMGNAPRESFRAPLERLAQHPDARVREPALWALARLNYGASEAPQERPWRTA